MSDEQKREWEMLGAELAELSPEKYREVLEGLRCILKAGRDVTAADWAMLLFGGAEPRLHA